MRSESRIWAADDERYSRIFHEVRGSKQLAPVDLPWLDAEKAVFIAVNQIPDDDIAIALDYRTDRSDPRVVASEWVENPCGCIWREVAGSFSEFMQQLEAAKNAEARSLES